MLWVCLAENFSYCAGWRNKGVSREPYCVGEYNKEKKRNYWRECHSLVVLIFCCHVVTLSHFVFMWLIISVVKHILKCDNKILDESCCHSWKMVLICWKWDEYLRSVTTWRRDNEIMKPLESLQLHSTNVMCACGDFPTSFFANIVQSYLSAPSVLLCGNTSGGVRWCG